ncbi:SARP family transcriptional regulator, partial [Micromonospora phytophila]|nr:SARP family transcriptional regulator [Micromonospora phytophila]
AEAEAAYRAEAARLGGSGMPGLADGLLPLALLSLRFQGTAAPQPGSAPGEGRGEPADWPSWDFGPYEPWVRPLVLLAAGRRDDAAAALRTQPESPRDLLYEARLCLTARAALALGDRAATQQTYARLLPAAGELAGAGSGLLTFGPVARYLDDLAAALGRTGATAAHQGGA